MSSGAQVSDAIAEPFHQTCIPQPYKIAVSTPFDFGAKKLTPCGGLFPVATRLEKLDFKILIQETLSIPRIPRAMTIYQFLLGMVLAIYIGFSWKASDYAEPKNDPSPASRCI